MGHHNLSDWPECIEETPGERWGTITHENPIGVDDYPNTHPLAASLGDRYLGDVCPYCGVPIKRTLRVVLVDGTRGIFREIDPVENPTPAYHPGCWDDRIAEVHSMEITRLDRFSGP